MPRPMLPVRTLPVMDPVEVPEGACCEACAARPAQSPVAPADAARPASPRRPIRRGDDRRVTFGGLIAAAGLLGLAAIAAVHPFDAGRTVWLPLHLALAGAAGTAIASVMPFFTTALGRVAPAPATARVVAIVLIAGGAVAVSAGVAASVLPLATAGGLAYIVGLVVTAAVAFAPLRTSLGIGLRVVPLAYAAAIACVVTGAGLATAMVAGWPPVATAWGSLKPAHAWLNVFGFLAVVIAATLIHLAPTVVGARIRPRRSATIALSGLVAGPPLVALGFALGSDAGVWLGGTLELVGALALVHHGFGVGRDRGRWTGDAGWHRFTGTSLVVAPVWFLVAVAFAVWPMLERGATPAAWSVDRLAVPLALGWVAQVLIGSWTHLVPAIGPGDPPVHARQRRRLGRWAVPRLLLWNGGVALIVAGGLAGSGILGALGAAAVAIGLIAALGLLVASAVVDPRSGGRCRRDTRRRPGRGRRRPARRGDRQRRAR